jgi:superoxide dismutase, Cu-Zn family
MGQHERVCGWLLAAVVGVGVIGAAASVTAATSSGGARHAEVTLRDRAGAEIGWATLTESSDGRVHVNVKVDGLSPGLHGIHVHAQGTCTGPDFSTAGGHHNPLGAAHGSHAGDLPNLAVNGAGRGRLNATTDAATLSSSGTGVFDGDGSAMIVHANPDDFVTQPTGNSCGRVACGVVTAD